MSQDAFGNNPSMTHQEMLDAGLINDDEEQTLTPKGKLATARLSDEDLDKLILEMSLNDEAFAEEVRTKVGIWEVRGDGVAIYRNMDMGHPHHGTMQMVSFGSPYATIETDQEHLPTTLPDFPGRINWRYQIVGWHRGQA